MPRSIVVDKVDFGLLREQSSALLRVITETSEDKVRDYELLNGVYELLEYMIEEDEKQN